MNVVLEMAANHDEFCSGGRAPSQLAAANNKERCSGSPFVVDPGHPAASNWVKEDTAASGSKSHSQAEKRRRDRINAQLSTLRKLIPKSDKMDKAALLGRVVEQVRDLKRKASEVSKGVTVPTDVDEVAIDWYLDQDGGNPQNVLIRASVCCDDRPELFGELNRALDGLQLTTVRADVACLGGRIKSILVLCTNSKQQGSGEELLEGVCINNVVHSLKGALSTIASSSSSPSNYCIKSKRQRFFLPP
ncbi:transcription factor bHLH51 [Diospyros lotus]|uniref:transcription factor bHLH51 n=1 Tax=Diospyros lotus TaxID=55363 RepID=UPI0022555328|nr:transcription factor bHLH51 [Diospyros lotus]